MDPVQRALWFVESHLRESLTLEEVAQACKVSAFHLTRAFAATVGLSLIRYLRGRRLSEAARALAAGAEDILTIALDAGYGSHEAFTRAFRNQFGLTPEQVRTQGNLSNLQLVEAITMNTAPVSELAQPRIETSKPMLVAGIFERYACDSPQGIPAQWQRFGPNLGQIKGQIGQAAYGVVYNFDGDSNFDYMCGVEITDSSALPRGFKFLQIPSQKYAIFRHSGHVAGIRATIAAIWSKWFPDSGFQADEGPTLERYGPEFNPVTGLGGFEIWIPIQPRSSSG
jgi:AraC family transcriptional regulator